MPRLSSWTIYCAVLALIEPGVRAPFFRTAGMERARGLYAGGSLASGSCQAGCTGLITRMI